MWPLISPASGAPISAILVLISEWPVFHISGLPPARCDLVEQRLARLDVGDDGGAGMALQHVARPQHQQLVAPQDAALAVDRADAVAVAVEGDAEVAAVASSPRPCSCSRFFGTVGSGWCAGKVPSTFSFSTKCSPGSLSTTARIDTPTAPLPVSQATLSLLAGLHVLQQARGIVGQDVLLLGLALRRSPSRPWPPSRPASGCRRRRTTSCPSSS